MCQPTTWKPLQRSKTTLFFSISTFKAGEWPYPVALTTWARATPTPSVFLLCWMARLGERPLRLDLLLSGPSHVGVLHSARKSKDVIRFSGSATASFPLWGAESAVASGVGRTRAGGTVHKWELRVDFVVDMLIVDININRYRCRRHNLHISIIKE